MRFYYDVIESRGINIDFQDIYNYIKNAYPDYSNYDIYEHFIENIQYYLITIYKCNDFVSYDNEINVEHLLDCWNLWFDEKFGENWDIK